mgnify:CR=1 FL=1
MKKTERYGIVIFMEIAKRLALVLHWMGFVGGAFLGWLALTYVWDGGEDAAAFLAPVIFLFFTANGWLLRYIIVGKVHFLPWR